MVIETNLLSLDQSNGSTILRMIDIFQQYEGFHKENVMLSYRGEISFDLVKSMLDNVEARLEQQESSLKTKKKVFNVLVECFHNLSHHIESSEVDLSAIDRGKMAVLQVWYDKKNYYVSTGNHILNDAVPKLEAWLKEINSRDDKSLRALYKEVLNNETFSKKGGGGLGFIDITRKSGSKMGFKFHKVNKTYSFFEFNVKIPKEI